MPLRNHSSITMKQLKTTIKKHNKKHCLKLSGTKSDLRLRIITAKGVSLPKAPKKAKKTAHGEFARQMKRASNKAKKAAKKRSGAPVAKAEPTSGYGARKGQFM